MNREKESNSTLLPSLTFSFSTSEEKRQGTHCHVFFLYRVLVNDTSCILYLDFSRVVLLLVLLYYSVRCWFYCISTVVNSIQN
jgi:hypothetical protein